MAAADDIRISIRVQIAAAAAVAMIGLAGVVRAQADPVDLRVVDRDKGQELRTWRHHGRLFVAGPPGDRYALRVINNTEGRVLLVMSVDGVNILTGETADYGQKGYVLTARQSYDVTGWRKSDAEIAAFIFAPQSQSYAVRTGRPADVGVIGMAVFKEKVPISPPEPEASVSQWRGQNQYGRLYSGGSPVPAPRPITPQQRTAPPPPPPPPPPPDMPAPAPLMTAPIARAAQRSAPPPPAPAGPGALDYSARAVAAAQQDEKLGTAHGGRESSVVNTVLFERATVYPQSILRIEYDTYAHLLASGVIPRQTSPEHHPWPFPSHPDGAGYVPDPPGAF